MKRIAVGISYVTMFAQFTAMFFVTPYILKQLGQSEYGLYQLVASTASYLSLLGFGFSASYIRYYSRFKTKNDDNAIQSLNGMFLLIFLLMSVACLAVGVIICINIKSVLGDKLSLDQYDMASKMMFMLALNMAMTFPRSIFICNTTAHEKFVFQKSLVLFVDILTPILQISALSMFKNAFSLTCVTAATTLINLIINVVYNIGLLKMRFSFKNLNFTLLKEIAEFTFFIFLNQILDLLSSTNIDNYLIGRISGTNDVTIYSMGSKISQMFHSVATPISAVFVPTIYQIVENGDDKNKLTGIFTQTGKYQFVVLFWIYSSFILWGKKFINIWLGDGYEKSYYIAIILMGSLIVALSQNIGIEIQRAKNKHRVRSVVYLLIDIANVFISIPLIISFGPIGASIGTAIAMFLGTIIFMNIYYRYVIGICVEKYWLNVIRILVCASPCIVAGVLIKRFILEEGLFSVLLQIGVYSILYFFIIYSFLFQEKKKLLKGIKSR